MTLKHSTERDAAARRAALSLLSRGEATLSEVAQMAGVSRQLARYWVVAAGVDWQRVRAARLAKAWKKEMQR